MPRREELEFLPAALELERTPPLPISRWIMRSIMAFFVLTVLWASFSRVDITSVAHGKIVPAGRVKSVQAAVTAVVSGIHVTEDQTVSAGGVVIQLDDRKPRADLDRLLNERQRLEWDHGRLSALLARMAADVTPGAQSLNLPSAVHARVEQEFLAFESMKHAHDDELRRNRAETDTISARIARLDGTLPLLSERVGAARHLAEKSLAPRMNWLELEQLRLQQAYERRAFSAELRSNAAARAIIHGQRSALIAKTEAGWRAALAEVESDHANNAQDIRKAQVKVDEHRLTSAVDGTVQQLTVNTVGGVVRPGEKLMLVVPSGDGLKVEAWVANKDAGFIHDGQEAVVKIETFPFTKYGTIAGSVESISDDAVTGEDGRLVYLTQVALAKSALAVRGELVPLTPGMAVTVEFNIGHRRVVEFVLAPVLRFMDEGLRER